MDDEPFYKIKISRLIKDKDIESNLGSFLKDKVNTLNIRSNIELFKFETEYRKLIDGILCNKMPDFIIKAIVQEVIIDATPNKIKQYKKMIGVKNITIEKVKKLITPSVKNSRYVQYNANKHKINLSKDKVID